MLLTTLTTSADPVNLGCGCLLVIGVILGYLLPTGIAMMRNHQNAGAIFLLNLLLGWTLLGWILALVWSATAVQKPAA